MCDHRVAAPGSSGRDPRGDSADGGRGGRVVVDRGPREGGAEADLVALSADALVLTDVAGKILSANPAAARLLNLPAENLLDHVLTAHVAQADRRLFRTNMIRAAEGDDLRFSFDVVPRGLRPLRVRARVAATDRGLAWVIREQAALGPDEPVAGVGLDQVVEGIRDGVVVVDSDLRVRYANRAARLILAPHGLEVGDPLPDPWPTSLRLLVTDLLEHEALAAEALVAPDRHTDYWIKAYRTHEGQRAVVLISDITAAERREQAERDFIANAAHELQSPLTAISNAVEVLLGGAHRSEQTRLRFLQHVADANDRLSRLLQSLLLLAEAQAGGLGVASEPVQLRPALEALAAGNGGDGPTIDVLCPEDLAFVTHRGLFEHAVKNVLDNACRHGGGSRVLVSARRNPAGRIVVEVADQGPGLTAEQRAQAFERFYRGSARDGHGFGLGLAIVREAVRALGGEVELRPNTPRPGLTARLTFGGGV